MEKDKPLMSIAPEAEKPAEKLETPKTPAGVPIDVPAGKEGTAKPADKKEGDKKTPERAPDAMTGSQFVEAYKQCKTPEEKQRLLLSQVAKGALSPESLKPKTYETVVNGQKVKIKMLNNLAIGVPGDSVRICTDAFTSQAIAEMMGGVLPTKDFQKRLYDDPSVPRVPFFTGEQLEARVNAKRREQGLPPLNINIETPRGIERNGVAMESGEYMEEHSRMLDEWMEKHGIDKDKVNVGSGKSVLAPYEDDGKLVFGGGLYSRPVMGTIDGKRAVVDYDVTGRIVQDIGDKAHGKIYADYSSRLDVVLSVEMEGIEVNAQEFMKDSKYSETRVALFGERSGAGSRYSYPAWMKEMVDEYKAKSPEKIPEETPSEAPAEVAMLIPGNKQQIAGMPSMQVDIAPDAGQWHQQIQQIRTKLPKGYKPPSGDLPKEVVAAANDFLDIKPFGSITPFEYNGQRYLAVKEWHPPHKPEQGPPFVQHPGISIFVGQGNAPTIAVEPAVAAAPEPQPTAIPVAPEPRPAVPPAPEAAPLAAAPSAKPAPQLPSVEIAPAAYAAVPKKSPFSRGGNMPPEAAPAMEPAPAAEISPPEPVQPAPAPLPAAVEHKEGEPGKKGATLFMGDSITAQIEKAGQFGDFTHVETLAQKSQTSVWLLGKLEERAQSDPTGLSSFENGVVLIGTNDIGASGEKYTAEAIFSRIEQIWKLLIAKNVKVYACTIPPFAGYSGYSKRFEAINQKRLKINEMIMKSSLPYKKIDLCLGKSQGGLADDKDPNKLTAGMSGDKIHIDKKTLAGLYSREVEPQNSAQV